MSSFGSPSEHGFYSRVPNIIDAIKRITDSQSETVNAKNSKPLAREQSDVRRSRHSCSRVGIPEHPVNMERMVGKPPMSTWREFRGFPVSAQYRGSEQNQDKLSGQL